MASSLAKLRTIPFGVPTSASTNSHNPGRYMYGSRQSTSYSNNASGVIGVSDKYKFLVISGRGTGSDPTEPWYTDNNYSTEDQTWQSGPFDNQAVNDHAMERAGYWTHKGGPNSDDNSTNFGYEMLLANANRKMIYNMGHGTMGSSAEGMEYGCVGVAGFWTPESDQVSTSSVPVSQGIIHVYCMYRMDASDEYLAELEDALTNGGSGGFTFDPTKAGHRAVASLIGEELGAETLIQNLLTKSELTGDLVVDTMGEIEAIIKVIKKVNQIWQGLGKNKEIDFMAECSVDGTYNEVPRGVDQHSFAADQPKYFCYHLNKTNRQVIQLLRMRNNGWLWHLTGKAAKGLTARKRISRFTDVVPLYASSPTKFGNTKYRKLLRHYDPNSKDDYGIHVDKFLTLDGRG